MSDCPPGCHVNFNIFWFRTSLVGDHFFYSHDLYVCFMDDIVRRN